MSIHEIFIVALGGGIGSALRYITVTLAARKLSPLFPYGTFIVNFIGCFFIGICMTLIIDKMILNPFFRLLIIVGFLGGFTTFSSFSYDTVHLLQTSQYASAAVNILLNVSLGLIATVSGIAAAKIFV